MINSFLGWLRVITYTERGLKCRYDKHNCTKIANSFAKGQRYLNATLCRLDVRHSGTPFKMDITASGEIQHGSACHLQLSLPVFPNPVSMSL